MDAPLAQAPSKLNYPIKPYKDTLRRLQKELVKKQVRQPRLHSSAAAGATAAAVISCCRFLLLAALQHGLSVAKATHVFN
jgi:hypothetical protein